MTGLKDLGKSLLGIAPALATALGGPLAGTAVKALSGALGQDMGEGEGAAKRLSQALSGGLTPEQLAAVRKADNEFAVQMRELDIDLARVHADDRASARRMQSRTKSLTAPMLAAIVMAAFILSLVGVFVLAVDDQPLDATVATLVGAVVGYASAKADQVVSFWFGSSEGGNDATQHLADAANGRK